MMSVVNPIGCAVVVNDSLGSMRFSYHHHMARLPFDPEKIEPPQESQPARRERKKFAHRGESDVLTVSQVSELIRTTLEEQIASPLRVIGELSNLNASRHWYFSLKDEEAVLSCVAWASTAKRIAFTPRDGDEVVATGHMSHYGPQGRTQFYVSKLQPIGEGALERRFREMCAELRGLGYFDPEHKIPLPIMPRRIAVITSKTGAAIQDVIDTAAQRCKAVGLVVVDVRVQGEDAAAQIARAIRYVDRNHEKLGVDAMLVTRGGGAIEDLWAFNERIVADAAFACELPLVAAIGHESDTTVIELVADVRAATPTQAAVWLIPSAEELRQQMDHQHHRLEMLNRRYIERAQSRLDIILRHPFIRSPRSVTQRSGERIENLCRTLSRVGHNYLSARQLRIEQLASRLVASAPQALMVSRWQKISILSERLREATRRRVDQRQHISDAHIRLSQTTYRALRRRAERIAGMQRELNAIDPLAVLSRGYSITRSRSGDVIRKIKDVDAGQHIVTRLADGSVESVVSGATRRRRRSSRSRSRDQMDLFGKSD